MTTAQVPDDDISYRIWAGTIVTVVPATLVVALRIVARLVSHVGLWWDDCTIMVSLVGSLQSRCPLLQGKVVLTKADNQLGNGCDTMGRSLAVWLRTPRAVSSQAQGAAFPNQLHRGAVHVLHQCRLHQDITAAALPPGVWRRAWLSLGVVDLRVPHHGVLYRMCHCGRGWLQSRLVLLEQGPAGTVYQGGIHHWSCIRLQHL